MKLRRTGCGDGVRAGETGTTTENAMKKATKPARKGQVVTSELPMTKAAPLKAPSQGGQLVGGFPALFGVATGAAKGRPKKKSGRRVMF